MENLTLEEIRELHPGAHIQEFDAGCAMIEDDDGEYDYIPCLDVIVWASEEDSENDDGAKAIARYMVLDK